jgi:tetratricopeptide (TPR) repeat protein
LNQPICNAKGFEIIGDLMSKKNKFDSAEYYFTKAEKIYQQYKCNDSLLINLYGDWAHLQYLKANFSKAQEYSLKMLHCAEVANNFFKLAIANTMVAQLFNEISQPQKAIVYTRNAVKLLPKVADPSLKRFLIYTLASRYLWHYQDTKTASSLDSSELFGNQLLFSAKQQSDNKNIARAFQSLQSVVAEKGNLNKSLQLLDSAIKYTDINNYYDLRLIYYDKADILIRLHLYDAAQIAADSVLALDKLVKNKANIVDAYSLMSKIAQEKGDYKKAFIYKELEKNINDSLTSVERSASVAELEEKYNQANNEKTIVDLAKQKQLYLLLALTALLFVAIIGLFLRQQSLKSKKEILEAEQRLNRARMNPHFLFNSLTSLQKIALADNNGKNVAANLSKFSNIMRATLESTYKEYISIEQEIEFLNEYLDVQKNRFVNEFSYSVTANEAVEMNELFIPPMLIQPFIENSIEHGFANIDYTAHIDIDFTILNEELIIKISDNGKGFGEFKLATTHISRANQIVKERLYLLNLKQKTKARFTVDDIKEAKGVVVKIYLPVLYHENINLV